jgi:hypothetical protein
MPCPVLGTHMLTKDLQQDRIAGKSTAGANGSCLPPIVGGLPFWPRLTRWRRDRRGGRPELAQVPCREPPGRDQQSGRPRLAKVPCLEPPGRDRRPELVQVPCREPTGPAGSLLDEIGKGKPELAQVPCRDPPGRDRQGGLTQEPHREPPVAWQ